jgi:hypothetical protein
LASSRGRSAYGQFLDRLEALGCEFCDTCYSYQWPQTDNGGHTCAPLTDGPAVPLGQMVLADYGIGEGPDGQFTLEED